MEAGESGYGEHGCDGGIGDCDAYCRHQHGQPLCGVGARHRRRLILGPSQLKPHEWDRCDRPSGNDDPEPVGEGWPTAVGKHDGGDDLTDPDRPDELGDEPPTLRSEVVGELDGKEGKGDDQRLAEQRLPQGGRDREGSCEQDEIARCRPGCELGPA